jgi:2-oxoisovalerate dehydrogenase E1 component
MTQAASLRWRTAGEWSCPLTIIAPYGAYLPAGGLWHSESNEGMLAHIQGIRIAIPSTPDDAAALLWEAVNGNDPTLILLPKHIFRKRIPSFGSPPALGFGKAVVRQAGKDVTLVSWGNGTELAELAAKQMAEEGVSVETIDLRTIVPCDYKTVEKSLAKTGRLVVVHEDARTTGFGQSIIAEMTSDANRWNHFLSAPQLVARKDVQIPFNPSLEYAVLPDLAQVIAAIKVTMQ